MKDENGECVAGEKPCESNPLIQMQIWDGNKGVSSNRFGCVRENERYTCDDKEGIRIHKGIDLMAQPNTRVFSLTEGIVYDIRHTDDSRGYGHHVVIQSGDLFYMYAHFSKKPPFNKGDRVTTGQIIGRSGDSDAEKVGPHLRFEVRSASTFYGGTPLPPEDILGTKFDDYGKALRNDDCD